MSDSRLDQLSCEQAKTISVHEPKRFAATFEPCYLNTLAEVFDLLVQFPGRLLFLEIKKEVFNSFAYAEVVAYLQALVAQFSSFDLLKQLVIISYDIEFLAAVNASHLGCDIGWVIKLFNQASYHLANTAQPQFLICNYKKVDAELWPGPWQWMLYDIVDAHEAKAWQQKGVAWIESWDVALLISQWRAHEL